MQSQSPTWKTIALALAAIVLTLLGDAGYRFFSKQVQLESRVTALEISFSGLSSTLAGVTGDIAEIKMLLQRHMEKTER